MNQQDRVAKYGNPAPQDSWIGGGGKWDHVDLSPSLSAKSAFPALAPYIRKLQKRDNEDRRAKKAT